MDIRSEKSTIAGFVSLFFLIPALCNADLIGFYPFEDGASDLSGQCNTGSVQGAVVVNNGFEGNCYSFDGIDDYLTLPINVNPSVNPRITFGAWINTNVADRRQTIISHDDGAWDRTLQIREDFGPFLVTASNGNGPVPGGAPIQTGEWLFVCVRFDSIAGVLSLNVDESMVQDIAENGEGDNFLNVGRHPFLNRYFDGLIDNVFVFDEFLTDEQVEEIRQGGSGILAKANGIPNPDPCVELIGFYPFDSPLQRGLIDESSQNNHAISAIGGASISQEGFEGLCYSFDGFGDRIQIPIDISPSELPQVTVGCWAKLIDNDSIQAIISHDDGGWDRAIHVDFRGSPDSQYRISALNGSQPIAAGEPVSRDDWIFMCARYNSDSNLVRLTVDTTTVDAFADNSDGFNLLMLGSNPCCNAFFAGLIDNVFVFDGCLTDEQVENIRLGGASAIANFTNSPTAFENGLQFSELNRRYDSFSGSNAQYQFSDDFVLEAGNWTIDGARWSGGLSEFGQFQRSVGSRFDFDILVFEGDGRGPTGSPLDKIPGTAIAHRVVTGVVGVMPDESSGDVVAEYTANFEPIHLQGGIEYWFAVAARGTFTSSPENPLGSRWLSAGVARNGNGHGGGDGQSKGWTNLGGELDFTLFGKVTRRANLRQVAVEGQVVKGSDFTLLRLVGDPFLNDDGQVAFIAIADGDGKKRVFFDDNGESSVVLTEEENSFNFEYEEIRDITHFDRGDLVVDTTYNPFGPGLDDCLVSYDGNELRLAACDQDYAFMGRTDLKIGQNGAGASLPNGDTIFVARVFGGGLESLGVLCLADQFGEIEIVAYDGQEIPGSKIGSRLNILGSQFTFATTKSGRTLFQMRTDESANPAIFEIQDNGSFESILVDGDSIGEYEYTSINTSITRPLLPFKENSICTNGFVSNDQGSFSAILEISDGDVSVLLRQGEVLPHDGSVILGLNEVHTNFVGDYVLKTDVTGFGSIVKFTNGSFTTVAKPGDLVPERTNEIFYRWFFTKDLDLNQASQVAFLAESELLERNIVRTGIFVSDGHGELQTVVQVGDEVRLDCGEVKVVAKIFDEFEGSIDGVNLDNTQLIADN
ncbi:MAG: LamG domain-containing protein, partial [Planctomycetota bacterium]